MTARPSYPTPEPDPGSHFAKRPRAGQELQPPGTPEDRPRSTDPKTQGARYAAEMDKAFRRAFPPYGKSTAERLKQLHGQKLVSDYMPTPKRRS